MKKLLALAALFVALSTPAIQPLYAQQHKEHAAGIDGTWDMTLHSHQLALVLKQEGKKVTATLMMPGQDVPLAPPSTAQNHTTW